MKIIDGHELAAKIKKAADERRDSGLYILAGVVVGVVKDMPEAQAYTEAKQRIENMEKIIEDQQERIDIMAADMPEWHFVNFRPLTEEEKAHYKDEYDETPGTMIENCPDDGEEVILWDGIYVQTDTYFDDDVCFDKAGEVRPGMAWMPLPKPPKGADQNG